eukprot:1619167-Rhodomonas_salina.1
MSSERAFSATASIIITSITSRVCHHVAMLYARAVPCAVLSFRAVCDAHLAYGAMRHAVLAPCL